MQRERLAFLLTRPLQPHVSAALLDVSARLTSAFSAIAVIVDSTIQQAYTVDNISQKPGERQFAPPNYCGGASPQLPPGLYACSSGTCSDTIFHRYIRAVDDYRVVVDSIYMETRRTVKSPGYYYCQPQCTAICVALGHVPP